MSTYYHPPWGDNHQQQPTTQPQQPNQTKNNGNWYAPIINTLLALAVGVGVGFILDKPSNAAPAPTPTVTQTEKVPRDVTPVDCLTFINDADKMNSLAGKGFGITRDIFQAIYDNDSSVIEEKSIELQTLSKQVEEQRAKYEISKAECLSHK